MITKEEGYYSIDGNPIIVDKGLKVSFSDDKELIIYATENDYLEAFPETVGDE
tara:strand:+ start:189 stop:347 length:159 start_codon:yes stop_codon:yes gene_type:complete